MNLTIDNTYIVTFNSIDEDTPSYDFTIKPTKVTDDGWILHVITTNNSEGFKQSYRREQLLHLTNSGKWFIHDLMPKVNLDEELFKI
jgi:hypothetical protein